MGDNVIKLPDKSMKSKRPLVIPVSKELRALLLRRRLKTKGNTYVFPSPKAPSGHLENPHKAWYKAIEKAKIKNLRFHDLRHTFASRLADNGVTITDIQALLGHSDIRITGRYISNSKDRLRQAVESISSNKATEHLRNY